MPVRATTPKHRKPWKPWSRAARSLWPSTPATCWTDSTPWALSTCAWASLKRPSRWTLWAWTSRAAPSRLTSATCWSPSASPRERMRVSALHLTDFRSYEQAHLELGPGVTTLVGRNGQGKTNVVEAIHYLATLSSHRVATDA